MTGNHREQFLWIWFFVVFCIVTISANKHKHYVVVGLPVFVLMASQAFSRHWQDLKANDSLFSRRSSLAIGTAAMAGAGIGWHVMAGRWPHLQTVALTLCCFMAIGGLISAILLATRYRQTALAASIATALACYICANGWLMPARDDRLAAALFAQEISSEKATTEDLNVFGLGMHPIVYYLEFGAVRLDTLQDVQNVLTRQPVLTIVGNRDEIESLNQLGDVQIVGQCSDHAPANLPIETDYVVAVLRSRGQHAQAEKSAGSQLR